MRAVCQMRHDLRYGEYSALKGLCRILNLSSGTPPAHSTSVLRNTSGITTPAYSDPAESLQPPSETSTAQSPTASTIPGSSGRRGFANSSIIVSCTCFSQRTASWGGRGVGTPTRTNSIYSLTAGRDGGLQPQRAVPSSQAELSCRRWASRGGITTERAKAKPRGKQRVEHMDFPGGRVPFTSVLTMMGGPDTPASPMPCYRTIDSAGVDIPDAVIPFPADEELAVKIHTIMARLQTMDTIFYDAQRQGRFSFYMTSHGEEATAVGSAAALTLDDTIFTQYREHGVLLWRGFTMDEFANQCFGNAKDPAKGRQMPIHYGSKALNFHTIGSSLATQLPHAVGAAYALKLEGKAAVAVAYFGEGAASEGDFHAALNFAATLEVPVIFICRNNGWAISTPAKEQYRGDGIASRGPSYGIASMRVDGGDARAMYNATAEARRIAVETQRPVLIEAMSYRSGHHSTSDDSSRYRTSAEIQLWRARDPATRFGRWLEAAGWWNETREVELRRSCRLEVRGGKSVQVTQALDAAQRVPKASLSELFTDVYDEIPATLLEQQQDAFDYARANPGVLPHNMTVL